MSQEENKKIETNENKEVSNEGKNISFKIDVPEGASPNGGTRDIKSTTESSGVDRSPNNDLELTTYETQSIEENVAPWKHSGPWYKDISKRRWFAFAVIVILIIIIIVVVPVTVANARKNQ